MSRWWLPVVTGLAAVGSGLIAGVFFAFSSFVMKALARLPASQGVAAMQSINVVVLNRAFLGVFVGTAAACGVVLVRSLWRFQEQGAAFRVLGAVLYLVGTFAVTRAFNVPRNEALDRLNPTAPEAGAEWEGYVSSWTAWNHVRTAAATAAMVAFLISLASRGGNLD
jgi:uncharacterized membrane protein